MYTVLPGDVVAIFDPHTRPNKIKWHLCVCHENMFFLRINSNPYFRPNTLLSAMETGFLKHDSYLELARLFEFPPGIVSAAIAAGGHKGRLGALARRDVVYGVEKAPTLTPEQKELIWEQLTREQDVPDDQIWGDFR